MPPTALILAALLAGTVDAAQPAPLRSADSNPRVAREQPVALPPRPLAEPDVARYRRLFDLQRQGKWADADALATELGDKALVGHLLAARYLARKAPRAGFAELAAWLERYADLPQAPRIHKLALARKPTGAAKPRAPVPAGEAKGGPRDQWQAGLAAWRDGDLAVALDRFVRLARNRDADEAVRGRAAFWAARASLRARRPQQVTPLLRLAADGEDPFYAPLAQKLLDDAPELDRVGRHAAVGPLDLTVRYPAARRALALGQVGEPELPDAALALLAKRAPAELHRTLLALAEALALPSAAGGEPATRGVQPRRAGALPVPGWQPKGGYLLDPSLVHAVIRAESGFDPAARSAKGALGLMQVLPETARDVAKLTRLAYAGEDWLLDPPTNMAVGQAWLRQLAAGKTVQGSLIHLLAAYNAGEGRLAGWLAKDLAHAGDDPLLFVESVPVAETRGYVKKVIANLWAYQASQGQRAPSLLALAENRWPELAPAGAAPPVPKAKARSRARWH